MCIKKAMCPSALPSPSTPSNVFSRWTTCLLPKPSSSQKVVFSLFKKGIQNCWRKNRNKCTGIPVKPCFQFIYRCLVSWRNHLYTYYFYIKYELLTLEWHFFLSSPPIISTSSQKPIVSFDGQASRSNLHVSPAQRLIFVSARIFQPNIAARGS